MTVTIPVRKMGETCHDLTLAERVVWSLLLPFVHVHLRFRVDKSDSVKRLLQLINDRWQEEDRRTIDLTAGLSKESCHLDRVSLSIESIISSIFVFRVLAFKDFLIDFTNHVPFSSFVVNLKSERSSSFTDRLSIYLKFSWTFIVFKLKFFPIFFAYLFRQVRKTSDFIIRFDC